MNSVQITTKSTNPFTKHEPQKLEYYTAFANKADFLIYDVGLYEPLNLLPDDEVTFHVVPSIGDAFTFTGVLYTKITLLKENHVRLHFVSKYFQKLSSTEPLFGKGKTSDIAKSFYDKTGVPNVIVDDSDISVDNVIFPRTAKVDDAINYMLNHSTAPIDSYLVGTIIGETAYIRNIKKGTTDIKGAGTKGSGGLYYQTLSVRDDRRRIDVMGGITMTGYSDSENVDIQDFSSKGTSAVKNQTFYGISDKLLAKARVRVKQLKTYYTGFTAVLGVIGCAPLVGSNLIVDAQDITSNQSRFRSLDLGKYFINSQAVLVDFNSSYPKSQIGVQLIDDSK